MHHFRSISATVQVAANHLRQSDRTVSSPGASQRHRQITFPLVYVVRNEIAKQTLDAVQELLRLRKRPDVTFNMPVLAAKGPKLRNKMRIRQETHVKDEVRLRWDSVAEAKADQRNEHGAASRLLEAVHNKLAQLVHVELCRVDNHVGKAADGGHAAALFPNPFGYGKSVAERMRAASLTEASQKRFIARFDEYERRRMILRQRTIKNRQLFDLFAFTRIDEQRGAFDFAAPFVVQFAEHGNQRDGQVVHTIKAQIFEGVQH